ncbi:M3 family metallopeptidase [Undibacterium sp. 14-3-2]|uniref:M3 family metallopeptidase n=1 Tax=Undibacterium sp. 14-3-2 TaxID=2800129 RepID=UPI0019041648|nr:M3 family metallopeptidase [Undibacterium sp. 14-3-2]MBK1888559.1 M3 family metallopeptidase [Undibacterium sp. 14-3-2]
MLMLLCSALAIQSSVAADTSVTSAPTSKPLMNKALAANPLLAASTLAYEYPAFDQIRNEHYAPAFAEGMRLHLAEINAIANNTAKPTFDNTVVALERAGQSLNRVSTIFFNQIATNTNPTLESLSTDLAPKLSAHQDVILMNAKLFKRINAIISQRDKLKLDAESNRLLDRYYTDFVRAGAKLSDSDKAKLKAINAQLASLGTKFSQNVLKETNASAVIVEHKEQLKGLSEGEINTAAAAAKAKGLDGKYLIPLMNTSGQPYLASLEDRSVRQRLQEASVNRGSHGGDFDNRDTALQLARLRAERAQLLGYPNYAAYGLEDETAKTTTAVNKMLSELAPAAVANAKNEAAELQKIIDANHGDFKLAAWDWAYYTEQLRTAKYAFDDTQLRPYFELDSVLQNGVFFAAHQLYGISFKERKDLPVYHPSVRVFEVFDADGKSMALFIADMYARDSKRGGAWMNSYVEQSTLFNKKPVIANHLNVPQPSKGEPTLLTADEVKTAFHEFGHALHGLFSQVHYPRFSGTNVPRDFVEYPSQVNEMWATWPEVLKNYAKHYKTGEVIPQALVDKITASNKFNQGFATTEYLAASLLDQRWHQLTPAQIPSDAIAFEKTALQEAGVDFAPVPPRYRSTYFSHIFGGGYSAGYYAYLWSEVLDADTVEWFKENGGLTRKNGDWFRQQLLSRGGSIDPMESFRNFRGRDPKIDPLLLRRGLK